MEATRSGERYPEGILWTKITLIFKTDLHTETVSCHSALCKLQEPKGIFWSGPFPFAHSRILTVRQEDLRKSKA